MDLETTVNIQTRNLVQFFPLPPPLSFLEGQAPASELSLCCLGVCIRMEAPEQIFGCGYNRNTQSCQNPRASISETAASSCALFHFTLASTPAQVRHIQGLIAPELCMCGAVQRLLNTPSIPSALSCGHCRLSAQPCCSSRNHQPLIFTLSFLDNFH